MYYKFFLLILIFPIITFSQANEFYTDFSLEKSNFYYPKISKINKKLEIIPGTIRLNDSLFMDVSLVNNIMYNEFYTNICYFWSSEARDSIKNLPNFGLTKMYLQSKLEKTKVDTSLITRMTPLKNTFVGSMGTYDYFRHPKFIYYPMVNITKYQAEMYCNWKSDMVKILASIIYKTPEERKKAPLNFKFRLPSKQELQTALDLYGYTSLKNKPINNIYLKPLEISFKKEYKKIYFIKDNISEFTLNNLNFGEETYTGFRCVCEVKTKY
ncbi:MAG: hypothetical protein K9I95_00320 [Flavobacteriaceae bacterium]|nr:hypothetical protein [Flavobacteriaceae bacterium]